MNKNFVRSASYETLYDWCLTIMDFMRSEFSGEVAMMDSMLREVLGEIDETRNLRKLKLLWKEMDYYAGDDLLSREQKIRLNQILREKFSYSLDDEHCKESDLIEKIIARGKIRNDREFELVKRMEEEIYDDDSQQEYAEKLRQLMSDYE